MTKKTVPPVQQHMADAAGPVRNRGGLRETLRDYWRRYNRKSRQAVSSGLSTFMMFAAVGAFKHS